MVRIGVLALQGAFAKHVAMMQKLSVPAIEVRSKEELFSVDGLILPGGESTVMSRLIQEAELLEPLRSFAKEYPVFGTCAGMILLSKQGVCPTLDISVERNAYGRQIDSFSTLIDLLPPLSASFAATFIRAPKIKQIHSSRIKVLALHKNTPILIQQEYHLAASFHPELTNDPKIHHYFLEGVAHVKSKKCSLHCC